jgi:serine/threonine protein kinase
MKNMKKSLNGVENKVNKGLGKYEVIKEIGRGNAGTVNLVQNKENKEKYALKTINLRYIENEKDRKNAENES